MQQLDAVLAWASLLQVFVGADPGDEVPAGGAVDSLVAEADDHASVLCENTIVAVAGQSPIRVDGSRPGAALVLAEHHQAPPLVGVLAKKTGKLLAIGGAEDERLARVLAGDLCDDPRLGPCQPDIGRDRLERHERIPLTTAGRAAMIEPEIPTVVEPDDTAEGHHAWKVERRHFLPRSAAVFTEEAWHPGTGSRAKGCREDPEAFLTRGIDQPVDARAVLVVCKARRKLIVESRPGQSAIVAASHRTGVAAVADAPDRKDRLAVGHEQRGRMALVDLFRPGSDDHLPILLPRDIDHRQVGHVLSKSPRSDRGQAEHRLNQQSHEQSSVSSNRSNLSNR